MKAILFLATFGFCNLALAAPNLGSGVSISPNSHFPSAYVDVTITGLAAEDLFNSIDPTAGSDRPIKQVGSTVCTRQVVADEARQASVLTFKCVINVPAR